jgi:hypothetical protein
LCTILECVRYETTLGEKLNSTEIWLL